VFDLPRTEKIDPSIFGRVCWVDFPEPLGTGSGSPTSSGSITLTTKGQIRRTARFYHSNSLYSLFTLEMWGGQRD